jgi:hypothetical protein
MALSFPAGEAKNASSEARKAGEWIERESGDVSHSSNTRSWQRLHLLEVGKACSIVLCDNPISCATGLRSSQGVKSNAIAAIAAPIPTFTRIEPRTIISSFCFKNIEQDAQKGRPAFWFIWFIWFVLFIWLIQTRRTNQMN